MQGGAAQAAPAPVPKGGASGDYKARLRSLLVARAPETCPRGDGNDGRHPLPTGLLDCYFGTEEVLPHTLVPLWLPVRAVGLAVSRLRRPLVACARARAGNQMRAAHARRKVVVATLVVHALRVAPTACRLPTTRRVPARGRDARGAAVHAHVQVKKQLSACRGNAIDTTAKRNQQVRGPAASACSGPTHPWPTRTPRQERCSCPHRATPRGSRRPQAQPDPHRTRSRSRSLSHTQDAAVFRYKVKQYMDSGGDPGYQVGPSAQPIACTHATAIDPVPPHACASASASAHPDIQTSTLRVT